MRPLLLTGLLLALLSPPAHAVPATNGKRKVHAAKNVRPVPRRPPRVRCRRGDPFCTTQVVKMDGAESRGLNDAQVASTIDRHRKRMEGCLVEARRRDPHLTRVQLEFVVTGKGSVLASRVDGERLASGNPKAISDEEAPRRAAVAIILHESSDHCCEVLFIRRSTHEEDPWSGHMAFPGGRVEADDASSLAAARRETREEVGLDLERDARLLGRLDEVRASARGRVLPMAIAPFVFHLSGAPQTRCNQEVEEALWVPIARLLDPANASTVPYELGGHRFELPAFAIDGRIIWGLTYQMLMIFFQAMGWELPLLG